MIAVLSVTVPVFILIGAGYVAVWGKLFTPAHVDGLTIFTQRFAIPCLLFLAMMRLDLAAGFDWRLLATYYSGSVVCFALGIAGTMLWLKRGAEDAIAVGFAAMFANTVLLGLPIAERAFGEDALGPFYAIIALHAALCYTLGVTAMEAVRAGSAGLAKGLRNVVTSLSRNTLMIGVALGLLVNLSGLTLPGVLEEPIQLVASAALPAALFGLGGVLVQYRPEGDWRGIALCAGISLIVHPAWTWSVGHALDLPQETFRAAVLTASMAPGVNAYIFSAMHGRAVRITASSVLIGTGVSVLTVSAWLYLL